MFTKFSEREASKDHGEKTSTPNQQKKKKRKTRSIFPKKDDKSTTSPTEEGPKDTLPDLPSTSAVMSDER